jgi:hypothetical protein
MEIIYKGSIFRRSIIRHNSYCSECIASTYNKPEMHSGIGCITYIKDILNIENYDCQSSNKLYLKPLSNVTKNMIEVLCKWNSNV